MTDYAELTKELREYSVDWHERPPLSALLDIAADAIEELLSAQCPHYTRNEHDRGDDSLCDKYVCEIAELPHWVSVKDKLPDPGVPVLTYGFIEFRQKNKGIRVQTRREGDSFFARQATHWMYLPQPPKEDEA